MNQFLGHRPQDPFPFLHRGQRSPHQILGGFLENPVHQVVKELECFVFIFDQRVFLGVSAQAHAGTQVIHFVQMFLPEFIDPFQHNTAFKPFLLVFAEVGMFRVKGFLDFPDDLQAQGIQFTGNVIQTES